MQQKRKEAEFIIQQMHVNPVNVTKDIQQIFYIDTPTNFRQDAYKITKVQQKRA